MWVGDGQGSLVRCSLWDRKQWDTTEQLNWNYYFCFIPSSYSHTFSLPRVCAHCHLHLGDSALATGVHQVIKPQSGEWLHLWASVQVEVVHRIRISLDWWWWWPWKPPAPLPARSFPLSLVHHQPMKVFFRLHLATECPHYLKYPPQANGTGVFSLAV